jgi:hypothetical protein
MKMPTQACSFLEAAARSTFQPVTLRKITRSTLPRPRTPRRPRPWRLRGVSPWRRRASAFVLGFSSGLLCFVAASRCQPLFWVYRAAFSDSRRLRGVLEGRCEAQAIVEEDRPRKARKDTEKECRPAPTRPDVPPSRTALSAPCVPSVFSVLSVVKFSSFLSGCGFANGKSTGPSSCGFAAWREVPRFCWQKTNAPAA